MMRGLMLIRRIIRLRIRTGTRGSMRERESRVTAEELSRRDRRGLSGRMRRWRELSVAPSLPTELVSCEGGVS